MCLCVHPPFLPPEFGRQVSMGPVCVYVCVCACACVCVREREREKERKKEREGENVLHVVLNVNVCGVSLYIFLRLPRS